MPIDNALVSRLASLHTALVCDVLDQLGHRNTFLGPDVAPLFPGKAVAGRAMTLNAVAVSGPSDEPYGALLRSFDHMAAGQVVVIATNGERTSGIWGELLSVAAMVRGVTGTVTDGLVRDVEQVGALGFPVFAPGASPLDCAGRLEVRTFGEPITCGDAAVRPGDYILGDRMGVAVIPHERIGDVLELAENKHRGETTARDDLARGDRIASVFARYGIL